MLKQILKTALVAAGVAAITPFAGAQGYVSFGGPAFMGRLGGGVVTPGVYSVFNPSAGYSRAMQVALPIGRPSFGSTGNRMPYPFPQPMPPAGYSTIFSSPAPTPIGRPSVGTGSNGMPYPFPQPMPPAGYSTIFNTSTANPIGRPSFGSSGNRMPYPFPQPMPPAGYSTIFAGHSAPTGVVAAPAVTIRR